VRRITRKKNPLKNVRAMIALNPYAAVVKRAAIVKARRAANPLKKKVKRLQSTPPSYNV